jgi:hypothetical protein
MVDARMIDPARWLRDHQIAAREARRLMRRLMRQSRAPRVIPNKHKEAKT